MTLAENEPTDQRLVSELPSYMRETRAAVNNIEGLESTVGSTEISIQPGSTTLVVGTDLGDYGYESISMVGLGVSVLETITNGSHGQVKVIIFQDGDVSMTDDNAQADGTFYLNQSPAGEDFEPEANDVIAIMNIGGTPGVNNGYWKELYRTLSVK